MTVCEKRHYVNVWFLSVGSSFKAGEDTIGRMEHREGKSKRKHVKRSGRPGHARKNK